MWSRRLPANLASNATTQTLEALRRDGIAVLDLTLSNPTSAGFDYPRDLLAPLADSAALVYDPQPLGLPTARAAVAADFARRGVVVPADRVALTASTSEAYALLFKLLCDPGDVVLVPQPSYPLFEHLTVLESIAARPYRLEYHGAWRIDVDSLRRAIDARTRIVLIVSPNNPTGSFLHSDDLVAVAELCATHDLVLVGDEVFADYPLDAASASASVLGAPRDIVACSLGGLSKSAGLPQVKLGWIAFSGPEARVSALMSAYEVVADTYLSVSTPTQHAAAALIAAGASIRAQIRARVARNLAALRTAAASFAAIDVLRVEGGWTAVIRVPSYRSEEALVIELLTRDHVLVHPGYFFDFAQESFLVLSLLVPPDAFDRGIDRVCRRATTAGAGS